MNAGGPLIPAEELLPWDSTLGASPGAWAEYAMLLGGYPVGPYLRFLVVGHEPFEGRSGTWIELWISQRPGSATQAYRMLVAADRSGRVGVRRAFVRLLGGEVQEIAPEELFPTEGNVESRRRPAATSVPQQGPPQTSAMLTPAGSFSVRQVRLDDRADGARAWFSEEVPLFGLVRLEVAGQLGLELHAVGANGAAVFSTPAPSAPPPTGE